MSRSKVKDVDEATEIIDVESEEVTSLGTVLSPNLPAIPDGGRVEVRTERKRADALRIGDDVRAPREGLVTGLWMQADGWLDVALDGVVFEVPMDDAVEVVVPMWRPGELLDQVSGMRAWGRLDPDVAQLLAQVGR